MTFGTEINRVLKLVFVSFFMYFLTLYSSLIYAQDTVSDDALDFIAMYAGSTPQEGNYEGLKKYLLEHPDFAASLIDRGSVRIVMDSSEGITEKEKQRRDQIKQKIENLFQEVRGILQDAGKFPKRTSVRMSVQFIPINMKKKYNEAQAEVKQAFSNGADEKIETMLSEFKCDEANQCVLDSFKKFIASNELFDKTINVQTQDQEDNYTREEMNAMARAEVIRFLKVFEPQDRMKVLQVLSTNFSRSISSIVEVFELQDLEGIDMDIVSKMESQQKDLDSNVNTNETIGTNKQTKKSIFSTIFDTIVYIPVTLIKSLRIPFKDISGTEMAQGIIPKVPAFLTSLRIYNDGYKDVAWAWWMAACLSFCLDFFHGAEASGWADFQSRMYHDKGAKFQERFNKYYGWFWAVAFRVIAYSAGTIPYFMGLTSGLFSAVWIAFMYFTGTVGAAVGIRGYNALNDLHYKQGVYSKQFRDFMQQWVRDFFLVVTGSILGIGGETNPLAYIVFGTSLLLDQTLWVYSQTVEQAPILVIGEKDVVESGELESFYPHLRHKDQIIPISSMSLEQALFKSLVQFSELPGILIAPIKNTISSCVNMFTTPKESEG